MTINSLKKEKGNNKRLYRDFPNSSFRLVISHKLRKDGYHWSLIFHEAACRKRIFSRFEVEGNWEGFLFTSAVEHTTLILKVNWLWVGVVRPSVVDYDSDADCPIWKKFIMEIMNYNAELIHFMQNAAGWAITGNTSEQTMFILFGTGANGKSTFLNTIMNLLGDYAIATPTETFMRKIGDYISNDIARLRGTRFVTTTEAEHGRRLSEPLIKQITGNDKMTARFLYGEFFNFIPTFKIFMATNHKPVIKGTDHGIWRRIKLVPFITRIEEDKQDKHLEQKLMEESPGILNWLIEGSKRWCTEGLKTPSVIIRATDEYRGEMDVIGNFIKERCLQGEGYSIKARELFKCYQDWCDDHNENAVSERFFGLRLKEIGLEQKRLTDGRYWQGIGFPPCPL